MFSKIILSITFGVFALHAQTFKKVDNFPFNYDTNFSQGCAWIDYDQNGTLDLLVTNGVDQNDFLYSNTGQGSFEKITSLNIVLENTRSNSPSWADYDNDGNIDLFISNAGFQNNLLFKNEGEGSFKRITDYIITQDDGKSISASWGDYDNDGYIDLFVANGFANYTNYLYKNGNGQGFTKINEGPIVTDIAADSRGCSWVDYDNDNDLDLFVVNKQNQNNFLYENLGNGRFKKIIDGAIVNDGGNSSSCSWGDYDNNGYLDLFVANDQDQHNFLYRNNGDGTFTKVKEGVLVSEKNYSSGSSWADFNNDGYLDLLLSIGQQYHEGPNWLYINDGQGNFEKLPINSVKNDTSYSAGTCCGDYDKDGFVDIFISNFHDQNNFLYRNQGNNNNWINIKLEGLYSNYAAIGAKVLIKANIQGESFWQMRQVLAQTGHRSQNSLNVEFGLGDATTIDTMIIKWPSGFDNIYHKVQSNQFLKVKEHIQRRKSPVLLSAHDVPNDQGGKVQLKWISSRLDTNLNSMTHYSIWRAIPENQYNQFSAKLINNKQIKYRSTTSGDSTYYWEMIGEQEAHRLDRYSFTASTLFNATPSNKGYHYFMISAHTSNVNEFYDSNIIRGYSMDNLHPLSPANFAAKLIESSIRLTWAPNKEDDLKQYLLYRGENANLNTQIRPPLSVIQDTFYVDENINNNDYYYVVKAMDINGNESEASKEIKVSVTNMPDDNQMPEQVGLHQNYPNPFNPTTTIRYDLPDEASVSLVIYNAIGQRIKTLVDKYENSGVKRVKWFGKDEHEKTVPSGIYFYKLKIADQIHIKKMILLR
ncbi:MAG: T9SS type A sorting domain-containing protein [Caldithrix sp.]|nr:T9SS type A sorting domain-containing protein [Caldithrix sp.]